MHSTASVAMIFIAGVGYSQSPVYHKYNWPRIEPITFGQLINTTADKIDFTFPVKDKNGTVVYTFRCIGGSDKFLDSLSGLEGECYVGDMSVHLYPGDVKQGFSILGYDASAYWHTRAQIRYTDLIGKRGAYPEYGRLRHFRLRGLELTIKTENIKNGINGKMAAFDLLINLRPDPNITCDLEEPCGFLYPRLGSLAPQKGIEPRMFRNHGGSWTEETKLSGPVPMPGASPATSPNKRYSVIWIEPGAENSEFLLILQDHKLGNAIHLLAFGHTAEVLWSPDSSHLAIIRHHPDATDSVHLFFMTGFCAKQLEVVLPPSLKDLCRSFDKISFELSQWNSTESITISTSAFSSQRPKDHAFKTFTIPLRK